MVTGYSTTPIAEARQRLEDMYKGMSKIDNYQKQAKEAEQYRMPAADLYVAARQALLSLAKDFEIFKNFIHENRSNLYFKESEYYATRIDEIDYMIKYYESAIIIPSLTGVSPMGIDNDTSVGASFDGTITSVVDGDTIIVQQVMTEDGSIVQPRPIRIAGIETAEGGTDHGKAVTKAASDYWTGKEVTVYYDRHTPNDMYGRVLGTVYWENVNYAIWSLSNCYSTPNLKFGKNHFVDPVEFKQAAARCIESWPTVGIVKVISKPPHAVVYVSDANGEMRPNEDLTPCEIKLSPGMHEIMLTVPGHSSVRDEIEVVANTKVQLPPFVLTKLPVDTGSIDIQTDPIDANAIVSVDDVPVGLCPLVIDVPLSPPSKITIVASGYELEEQVVSPILGKVLRIVATLNKKSY